MDTIRYLYISALVILLSASQIPAKGVGSVLKPVAEKRVALRAAIEDLMATFGQQYPRGREYLARLAELEKAGAGASQAEFAALQREALLANPLMRFDKLLLVRREDKGNLGLTPNWGGKTDIAKAGYDNEIAILSPVRPDGALTTLYRPAAREY